MPGVELAYEAEVAANLKVEKADGRIAYYRVAGDQVMEIDQETYEAEAEG